MFFAVVENSTGRIVRNGILPDGDYTLLAAQAGSGQTAYGDLTEDITFATHWYSGNTFVAKVSLDSIGNSLTNTGGWVANTTDTISYGNSLPNPTMYTITCSNTALGNTDVNGQVKGTITDGVLVLNTDVTGSYTITLSAFPYLDKVIEVSAS